MWDNRLTYICIYCRFASKYDGQCPKCRGTLRGMYNFRTPRKRDTKAWEKIQLRVLVADSGLSLCNWSCCVPVRDDFNRLTLLQYKARIRKRLIHRQGEVPKRFKYV